MNDRQWNKITLHFFILIALIISVIIIQYGFKDENGEHIKIYKVTIGPIAEEIFKLSLGLIFLQIFLISIRLCEIIITPNTPKWDVFLSISLLLSAILFGYSEVREGTTPGNILSHLGYQSAFIIMFISLRENDCWSIIRSAYLGVVVASIIHIIHNTLVSLYKDTSNELFAAIYTYGLSCILIILLLWKIVHNYRMNTVSHS